MVNVFNRLLQGDDMPFSCNLFLDSAFVSFDGVLDSSCRCSTVFVRMNGWARCCRSDTLEQMCRVFWRMLRGILRGPFERQPHVVSKTVLKSAFTHTVKPSRMKKTSSSYPDNISSSGYGSFRRSGKGLCCFTMVPPILPKRPKYPEFRRASKLVRQVLQLLATKILVPMRCPKVART